MKYLHYTGAFALQALITDVDRVLPTKRWRSVVTIYLINLSARMRDNYLLSSLHLHFCCI